MTSLPRAIALAAMAVLLAGCTTAPGSTPTRTVTITATPPTPTLKAAEAAPWDLHAVCAAESAISTLEVWRAHQSTTGRLSSSQANAVLQGIAVQYQNMNQYGVPSAVQQEVGTLAAAAGTLDRPRIDLDSSAVKSARVGLRKVCMDNGLTIGVYAQGG